MKNFQDLGLNESLVSKLTTVGYISPTEIQAKTIPLILDNKDVVGLSQTGTGKTFAFALPLIQQTNVEKYVQKLIICPTRELAEQILNEFKKFTDRQNGVRAVAVFGGTDMQRQIYAIKRGANIIIGTPGRILDHIKRKTLKLGLVNSVVLDEADEMLNMGFRQDIEEILKSTPNDRQTIMFSATMSNDILALTKKYMHSPITIQVGAPNTTITAVKQTYFVCPKNKKKNALFNLLSELPRGRTLIFCNTKKMVDSVQLYLRKMGFWVLALHGDMPQSVRRRVLNEYKAEPNNLLVTTDVAARGIDVKDIMHAYTLLNTPEQIKDLQQIEAKTHSKITKLNLTLNGVSEVRQPQKSNSRGKKLNIKAREKRAILSGRQNSNNSNINIRGNSKSGKKKRTLRQTHKSKIHY